MPNNVGRKDTQLNINVHQTNNPSNTKPNKFINNTLKAWLFPKLPWLFVILVMLMVVAGFIMYFLSGVGLVFEAIKVATDDVGHKAYLWWYGEEQDSYVDQEIITVADKLESMGYDLKGEGFLSEVLAQDVSDDEKKAQGLTRDVDLDNVLIDSSGIARDENGITNIKSDNLMQYLISSNSIYTLYNDSRSRFGKSGFIKLYDDFGTIGNKGRLYPVNNPTTSFNSNVLSLQFPFSNSTVQIDFNTKDKTMEIANVEGTFWWKKVNTFKYSLDGWTGRYGTPLELALAIHLASMQPDLAREIVTEFPTNINMLLHPVESRIIGHISIDGVDYTSATLPSPAQWYNLKNIKLDENGDPILIDHVGNPIVENGYDKHDRDVVLSDLKKVDNSFDMYYPYIADVTNHWFRDTYLTIGDRSLEYVKNNKNFEYNVGERWTDYETEIDENGNTIYTLYVVNSDGTIGEKYDGTFEQAKIAGINVSKKPKSETIDAKKNNEFIGSYWSAYNLEYNVVMIPQTPITPDVVKEYASITYKDEIRYEATTSEALRQVRDGERGLTNPKIKKMLTEYSYYTYNGQRERADSILEDKEKIGDYKHEDESGNLIDGTENDKRIKNLIGTYSLNSDSLSTFKLLENMNTLDADEAYRDFKELVVELDYFEKERFAGSATSVFQWPVPDCGTAGWPAREFEKIENYYGTLINSRTNLLNLKNLFLQYRQNESILTEEDDSTNPEPNLEYGEQDGALSGSDGEPWVVDGYITEAGKRQMEKEKEEIDKLKNMPDDYVPEEVKKQNTQSEGLQGQNEKRNAGEGGPVEYATLPTDFIDAEDESGAQGWYDTYDIVMDNIGVNYTRSSYGYNEKSYLSFLNGLGGVFAEYAGDENNGEGTYEDFMAACQYVYGLSTMFGFNYCNYDPDKCDAYQFGIHNSNNQSPNDAYYETGISSHKTLYQRGESCGGCDYRLMDDCMIAHRYCTNCNYTTDKVYFKAGLFDRGDGSGAPSSLIEKYGGNYVYNIQDLQVGDLIEHYDGGKWCHVSFVGEVNDDEIVVYETGHSWIDHGNFRFKYNMYKDTKPTHHETWVGVHLFDLQPRNRKEYEGYDGNVAVVSPITGEVIDVGETTITNIQTNEIETVGYIKIRALVAEDIGTSIPDTDISNLDKNPKLRVPDLKEGNTKEKAEYHYGGYKLFLEEYQQAKVTGLIMYIEGFDLRLLEKDESGKIRLKSRRCC